MNNYKRFRNYHLSLSPRCRCTPHDVNDTLPPDDGMTGFFACTNEHTPHSFMKESRNLLNNAAVVESMFREVGPGFATCFRYEDMADPLQAFRVAKFVAPTNYAAERLSSKMLSAVKIRSPPGGAEGGGRSLELAKGAPWDRPHQVGVGLCLVW